MLLQLLGHGHKIKCVKEGSGIVKNLKETDTVT